MSSSASDPNYRVLTTVTRASGKMPRTEAFGRRSSSLLIASYSARAGPDLPGRLRPSCTSARITGWSPAQPVIDRLPPKPPMPPDLLAGDPPPLGELVDRATGNAQVLGHLGNGHDGGIRFSHGMPRCLPCPQGLPGPRVDPLSRTMLIVAHCCTRRNRPSGRGGLRGRGGEGARPSVCRGPMTAPGRPRR